MTGAHPLRIGIDIRTADAASPGQQRMLWRLGAWLAARGHETHLLSVRRQRDGIVVPAGATFHDLHELQRSALRGRVAELALDALLVNPERARRYRGLRANVLRAGYGTEHYRQKLRSFRGGPERAVRAALRWNPWDARERRWERAFYESRRPAPDVVAQSAYMKRQILDSYDVPPEHVHVVHNGVDTKEFTPDARRARRDEARRRWSIPAGRICLLLVGHNYRLKGLWDLLDVLATASDDTHLLVAGRGTGRAQRAEAGRRIDRLGLRGRVTLAGPVDPALDAYAAADALLHLSWHDSFGFVVLEAMACGLPVVTTPFVGAAELIDDGLSGIVVDPGRPRAIASAVARMEDAEVRASLGAAAALVGAAHDEAVCFGGVEGVMRVAAGRTPVPVGAGG